MQKDDLAYVNLIETPNPLWQQLYFEMMSRKLTPDEPLFVNQKDRETI